LLLGLAILGVGFTIQLAVTVVFVAVESAKDPDLTAEKLAEILATDSLLLSVATIAFALVGGGIIALLIWLRKGASFKEYLSLHTLSRPTLLKWLGVTMLYIVVVDTVALVAGRPIVPESMVTIFQNARLVPLLWMTVIVVAPLFEELLFRGFLFGGLVDSRLGLFGTALLTSALWTALHIQYDAYELGTVFVLGLLLAIARHTTGSVYAAITRSPTWSQALKLHCL
jgi:membrane protease YdiL (CAAX protease family)